MSTPLGWHRACLLYDKLIGIPEPGSLREAVCILIQRQRHERDYYRLITIAAAAGGSSQRQVLVDSLEKFRSLTFPYMDNMREKLETRMHDMLRKTFESGPIRVNKMRTMER